MNRAERIERVLTTILTMRRALDSEISFFVLEESYRNAVRIVDFVDEKEQAEKNRLQEAERKKSDSSEIEFAISLKLRGQCLSRIALHKDIGGSRVLFEQALRNMFERGEIVQTRDGLIGT